MSSGAGVRGERGRVCVCWRECPCTHVCFESLVLTQTQPLHCPLPSAVRMFEGRLVAQLSLISAGTRSPVVGRLWPWRTPRALGQEARVGEAGKVPVKTYVRVNYRFLASCV